MSMVKRYVVCAGLFCYPDGGMFDYVGSSSTLLGVVGLIHSIQHRKNRPIKLPLKDAYDEAWVQVFDMEEGRLVAAYGKHFIHSDIDKERNPEYLCDWEIDSVKSWRGDWMDPESPAILANRPFGDFCQDADRYTFLCMSSCVTVNVDNPNQLMANGSEVMVCLNPEKASDLALTIALAATDNKQGTAFPVVIRVPRGISPIDGMVIDLSDTEYDIWMDVCG